MKRRRWHLGKRDCRSQFHAIAAKGAPKREKNTTVGLVADLPCKGAVVLYGPT